MVYLMDLTFDYRQRVEAQGYLEPEKIRPEHVDTADERTSFTPDWPRVVALLNIAETQSHYNTIVLYDNQRLVKVRPTPNQLIHRLGQHFALDYMNDIRWAIAQAVDIKRHVPFVCQDFWLMPMDAERASNRSWMRWLPEKHEWYYNEQGSWVSADKQPTLHWTLSRSAAKKRQDKCEIIINYLASFAVLVCPSPRDNRDIMAQDQFRQIRLNARKRQRRLTLALAGQAHLLQLVEKSLTNHQYEQLPESEV